MFDFWELKLSIQMLKTTKLKYSQRSKNIGLDRSRVINVEKTEILRQIKDAEARVEEMIKNAEEQKKKVIANAKLEAKKILSDAEAEAAKIKKEIIEKIRAQVDKEKEEIKAKKMQEIAEFETKGRRNVEKAVELLYKEFVGMMEHA